MRKFDLYTLSGIRQAITFLLRQVGWLRSNGGGGGGPTNLSVGSRTGTSLTINNSNGTNVTIPQATTTQAGLLSAADKVKLNEDINTGVMSVVSGTGIIIDDTDPKNPIISSTGSSATIDTNPVSLYNLNGLEYVKDILEADTGYGIREIGNSIWDEDLNMWLMPYTYVAIPYVESAQCDIYIATSTDGINWNKGNILNLSSSNEDPYLVKHNGLYYLYTEIKNSSSPVHGGIRLFTSSDLVNWENKGKILFEGSGSDWDLTDVSSPTVYKDDSGWKMLFEGRRLSSPVNDGAIGLATSDDGVSWTKYPGNPVVRGTQNTSDYTFDWISSVVPDDVVKIGNLYYMFCHPIVNPSNTRRQAVLYSTDFIVWYDPLGEPLVNKDITVGTDGGPMVYNLKGQLMANVTTQMSTTIPNKIVQVKVTNINQDTLDDIIPRKYNVNEKPIFTNGINIGGYGTKISVGNVLTDNRSLSIGAGGNTDSLSSAGQNIAIGYDVLKGALTAKRNTVIGNFSMARFSAATKGDLGSDNVGLGDYTVFYTTGSKNTAIGSQSLFSLDNGDDNTAIGYASGGSLYNGSKNIFIGIRSGTGVGSTLNNKLCIGSIDQGGVESDHIILGDLLSKQLRFPGYNNLNGDKTLSTSADGTLILEDKPTLLNLSEDLYDDPEAYNDPYMFPLFRGIRIAPEFFLVKDTSDNIILTNRPSQGNAQDPIGYSNTFIGVDSGGVGLENVNENVCIGNGSLYTMGSDSANNTSIGSETLSSATTANKNIALGYAAGASHSGNVENNIFIGYYSGIETTNVSNKLFIGNRSGYDGNESEHIILGDLLTRELRFPGYENTTGKLLSTTSDGTLELVDKVSIPAIEDAVDEQDVVTKFNELLGKLRIAGILESE